MTRKILNDEYFFVRPSQITVGRFYDQADAQIGKMVITEKATKNSCDNDSFKVLSISK
jgi:hypothetical protein